MIPADILLLSSRYLNNNYSITIIIYTIVFSELHGICRIETIHLDDEINLKIRQCPQETSYCKDLKDIINLNGTIECELPNKLLYHFLGRLTIANNQ